MTGNFQQQSYALRLNYVYLICDYGRLISSLQTNSIGTVPDLNGIITTELFATGNNNLNERENPGAVKKEKKKHKKKKKNTFSGKVSYSSFLGAYIV